MEWEGQTSEVDVPKLDAAFWSADVAVTGVVEDKRETLFDGKKGVLYRLALREPVDVDGESVDVVEVGNLSGFRMALKAAAKKAPGMLPIVKGDVLRIECLGVKEATREGYSARPNFHVKVTRPEGGRK